MLEKQKDIDAVVIATPDHFHAVATMTAMKLGKHVFVEKPLTHTHTEARALAEAAREAKVATQMGNQGHSGEGIRLMCEWIWTAPSAPCREVHAWTTNAVWPQGIERPNETPPVPETLDWDLWLGPAPSRPYHPAYLPASGAAGGISGGGLGDMGCHVLDPVVRALKLGSPPASRPVARSSCPTVTWDKPFNTETYPQASIVRYEFPGVGHAAPGVDLVRRRPDAATARELIPVEIGDSWAA